MKLYELQEQMGLALQQGTDMPPIPNGEIKEIIDDINAIIMKRVELEEKSEVIKRLPWPGNVV